MNILLPPRDWYGSSPDGTTCHLCKTKYSTYLCFALTFSKLVSVPAVKESWSWSASFDWLRRIKEMFKVKEQVLQRVPDQKKFRRGEAWTQNAPWIPNSLAGEGAPAAREIQTQWFFFFFKILLTWGQITTATFSGEREIIGRVRCRSLASKKK